MYSQESVALFTVAIVLPTLATVAVALRFQARRSKHAGYGADDWVMLVALITELAVMGMTLYWATAGGAGDSKQHYAQHPGELRKFLKILFVGPLIFALTITLIKISILLFYKRIFRTHKFGVAVYVVMAVVIAWFLASIFGTFFAVTPISTNWTHPSSYNINYHAYLLTMAVFNLALDVVILSMPLFKIRKLHMTTARKWGVIGVFWLGAFCIVASAVRVYYFVLLTRNQPVIINNVIWSFVEPCTSIVAGCLPTLATFWKYDNRSLRSIVASFRSVFSLQSTKTRDSVESGSQKEDGRALSSAGSQTSTGNGKGSVEVLWQGPNSKSYTATTVSHGDTAELRAPYGNDLATGIHVQRQYGVHHEDIRPDGA